MIAFHIEKWAYFHAEWRGALTTYQRPENDRVVKKKDVMVEYGIIIAKWKAAISMEVNALAAHARILLMRIRNQTTDQKHSFWFASVSMFHLLSTPFNPAALTLDSLEQFVSDSCT